MQRLLQDADRFRAEGDPRATIDAARLQELIDSSDEQLLAYTAEWLMQFEADGIGERLSREYVLNILLAQKIDVSSKRSRVDGWGSAFIADMRAYAARLLALNTGPTSATSVAVSPTEEDDPLPE